MWIIEVTWLPKFGWSGLAFFPFIFVKDKHNPQLLNHEKIHIQQQLELLLIGFIFLWVVDVIYCIIAHGSWAGAYDHLFFEREAYDNQRDLSYLDNRKPYNWINYL